MSDPLTPEELVRLAEYCGHEVQLHEKRVFPVLYMSIDTGDWEPWIPDLDANQRDELVEAVLHEDYLVHIHYCLHEDGDGLFVEAEIMDVANRLVANGNCKTPGLAVCRAALKVIGGITDENTRQ